MVLINTGITLYIVSNGCADPALLNILILLIADFSIIWREWKQRNTVSNFLIITLKSDFKHSTYMHLYSIALQWAIYHGERGLAKEVVYLLLGEFNITSRQRLIKNWHWFEATPRRRTCGHSHPQGAGWGAGACPSRQKEIINDEQFTFINMGAPWGRVGGRGLPNWATRNSQL